MTYYPRVEIVKIENAFAVEVRMPNPDTSSDFGYDERKEFAYQSIDNVIEKMLEVFKQDGK